MLDGGCDKLILWRKTWQLQRSALRSQEYNLVSSQTHSLPAKTIGVTASHFPGLISAQGGVADLTQFPLWSNSLVMSFQSSLTNLLQNRCWVRDVWSEDDQSAFKNLVKLRRLSFSGVTLSPCGQTFWDSERSLRQFLAVMLSLIQKCKYFLSFCLGNLKCFCHIETKDIAGPIVKGKSCTESAPALGRCTSLSKVTYAHENCCSGQQGTHVALYVP